ncbi:hypothetical protein BA700_07135 [Corynebacterium stationis]|nr:hypothetical protein AW169_07130 [Corynebacterium stationis]AQX71148.1 hypothetical protein CA21670_06315 [Corynebacterium stationis]ASJ18836.1 hypothetical protein BA700_07135 [Corynebacterium stationis]
MGMLSITGEGLLTSRTQPIWGSYSTANAYGVPIWIFPGRCEAQKNARPVLSLYRKFEKDYYDFGSQAKGDQRRCLDLCDENGFFIQCSDEFKEQGVNNFWDNT